jgi:hypothetical protein
MLLAFLSFFMDETVKILIKIVEIGWNVGIADDWV